MAQTGMNLYVAYKVESAFRTAPGATGGKKLRLVPSAGSQLQRALIESNEIRADMLSTRPRLGARSAPGTYGGELALGAHDDWLEAWMRSTWTPAFQITNSAMTSITTTTSTIVAAGGSWITQGVKVGDVVYLTNHSTAGNNNINLRVTGVSATTITVAGSPLTVNASADVTFELNVRKRLTHAATPTRRSFYVEEHYQDLDLSKIIEGLRVSRFSLDAAVDGIVGIEFGTLGANATSLATGASPYYSSPTVTTSKPLILLDGTVRYNGADVATITNLQIQGDLNAQTMAVNSTYSPDVFDNRCRMSGSMTMLKSDFANLTALDAETELELHVLLVENEAELKDCMAFVLPSIVLSGVDNPLGQENGMTETVQFAVGKKEGVTGYAETMMQISSSAA